MAHSLRFRDWPLRRKLMGLLLVGAAVPTAAAAIVEFMSARTLIEDDAAALLGARAEQFAAQLDYFHRFHLHTVTELAARSEVRRFASLAPDHRQTELEPIGSLLNATALSDASFHLVSLLDGTGQPMASSDDRPVRLQGQPGFLRQALRGVPSVSDIFLSAPEDGSVALVAYAAPVLGGNGRVQAVAVLFVRASAFWQAVEKGNGMAGEGSFSVLLDQDGIRIGHSFEEGLIFRPIRPLDPAVLEAQVAAQRFGPKTRMLLENWIPLREQQDHDLAAGKDQRPVRVYASGNKAWNLGLARKLSTAPWTLYYFIPEESLHAPVRRLVVYSVVVGAVLILMATIFGALLADRISRPLLALSRAATRFGRGELSVRVDLEGNDEVGNLAARFNDMAATLAQQQEDLERKVAERTAELTRANETLAGRNEALAAKTAEISRRQAQAVAYGRALAALAGQESLEGVIAAGLRELSDFLHAVVIVCYRLEPDGRLSPIASYGAGDRASPVSSRSGLMSEAFTRRELVSIDDLPPDIDLRFEAALATGRPSSIALVPLLVGEHDIGMLAVGMLGPLSAEGRAVLMDLSVPLALTIARFDLSMQRDRFSEELTQQNDELLAQAEELRLQSEELITQQRELEAQSREVENANRLKSEFIANMSHELRTPLNTVIGFSELLLEEAQATLELRQLRYLQDIRMSGRHLLSLINDILDLAKIEAGRVTLELEPVPPSSALSETMAVNEVAAAKKRITLRPQVKTRRPALADRRKLLQILINLVSNAVKFSPEGSTVELGCEDDGPFIRFWVEDRGPGIDDGLRQRLFQPFVQGENPLVKRHEGTGLGLAISKRLAEQHGGAIGVESSKGQATRFWFTIPAEGPEMASREEAGAPPASRPAPESVQASVTASPANQLPRPIDRPAPAARAPENTSLEAGARRILIIDDDPSVGTVLSATLERAGFRVTVCANGQAGLERAGAEPPDLIIVDLHLPDISGFELIDRLTADPRTASRPIIVVTARSLTAQEQTRVSSRVVAVAEKGDFTSEALVATVQRATASARPPAPSTVAPTILVADDHNLNLELCRTLLERMGYQVLLANDGEEALEVARRSLPALIFMDLAMPRRDGFSATRALKADPQTAHIPVVALTARAMRTDETQAMSEGFTAYMTKPIEVGELKRTVARLLERPQPEAAGLKR